jgi:hypothetical protein
MRLMKNIEIARELQHHQSTDLLGILLEPSTSGAVLLQSL